MRLVRFFMLVFCVCCGLQTEAFAQDSVTLRASQKAGYSRLVFVWPNKAGAYTLDQSHAGQVALTFKKPAKLDPSGAGGVPNILGVSVESEAPLRVVVTTPSGSKIRDMTVGGRVIVDVYDPPEGPVKPQTKKTAPEKPAVVPVKGAPKKPEPASEPVPISPKKAVIQKTEPPKAPLPKMPLEELPKDKAPPAPPETGLKTPDTSMPALSSSPAVTPSVVVDVSKGRAVPTTIFLSSTQTFGLAAFVQAGHVYVVEDKNDLLLKPQVNGPDAAKMGALEEVKTPQGRAYLAVLPETSRVKGEGEGLVWRVLVAPDLAMNAGIEPVPDNVTEGTPRSGALVWPLKSARAVIDLKDPVSGQKIKVVTVEKAEALGGVARHYVDFDVLESAIGLAIVPKVDDLEVKIIKGDVHISRPEGLTMVGQTKAESVSKSQSAPIKIPKDATHAQKVFDFKGWRLGGVSAQAKNRTLILEELNDLSYGGKVESLLTLAKMYLSNGMGPEALGFMDFAGDILPALREGPEFQALFGVAQALSQRSEEAFKTLSDDRLRGFDEINGWRVFALADLGDWQQAAEILPDNMTLLQDYPDVILARLGPVLAEVALRAGKPELAEKILALVEHNESQMAAPQKATLDYLKGEVARQKGKTDETKALWEPLTKGPDDLYRAKAGLALTRLLIDKKALSPEKAIDALERLRYAWRGDELEAQINYWLGRTYFESGAYVKGLNLMKEAGTLAPESNISKRIAGDMVEVFSGLFLGKDFEKVSPLDAVALYETFPALMPRDARSDQIIERLAEYLAKVELFDRAGALYTRQLQTKLDGPEAFRIAVRLAAIRLLDNDADKALAAINLADQKMQAFPALKTPENGRLVSLLRARALSRQGRPDQAMALLNDMEKTKDVNRLRADIAWTAGYWDDAAEALGDVILDQNISLARPLESENVALLLQRAIALSLAGDRIGLANMREKYLTAVNATEKAKVFEVITRPRKSAALADRETLLGVVKEVDLFADFLKSYKANDTTGATAPAAKK